MDPIDDVFSSMRVHTALYARIEASAPWGVTFVQGKAARFGLVVRGGCWLTVEGEAPTALTAGDCYVIASGLEYSLQDHPGSPTRYCYKALRNHSNHVVTLGGGEHATVITGWFLFDQAGAQPLVDLMPRVILTRMDGEQHELIQSTLQMLSFETKRANLGTSIMVSRLTDILFIQAIRSHAASNVEASGWLGALCDPRLSPVFRAIHGAVEHPWTVEELAEIAGMSRSAFAARFKERVGSSPLEYVTRWRMFRAGNLLRRGNCSTAEIAYRIGYDNESAFAKAFKRTTGVTPGAYRRAGGEAALRPIRLPAHPAADGVPQAA